MIILPWKITMNKRGLYDFLPIVLFIGVVCLYLINVHINVKKINIDTIPQSSSIVLTIDSIEEIEDGWQITGTCYDKNNIEEYNNWITGKGINVYNNFTLFVYIKDEAYEIETFSEYDALVNYQIEEEIDYSFYQFKAVVPKKYENYYLGVISIDLNKKKTKYLTEMIIEDISNK